ncbi:Disulfide-bond oxidoreductase YghU [Fusarium oxysporum f. sp. albedinis]|nr:Disulfide-bond oxidoreductase YghU [Fusarium oxysporum f. sp. albedinis]
MSNTSHLIKFDSWARTALLSCSCLCTHALGDQSLEDSSYVNGVFNRIVDKIVSLVDSEMTVVKQLTEDHVRVIVAGEFLRPSGTLLPQVEHSG